GLRLGRTTVSTPDDTTRPRSCQHLTQHSWCTSPHLDARALVGTLTCMAAGSQPPPAPPVSPPLAPDGGRRWPTHPPSWAAPPPRPPPRPAGVVRPGGLVEWLAGIAAVTVVVAAVAVVATSRGPRPVDGTGRVSVRIDGPGTVAGRAVRLARGDVVTVQATPG